jgi:hypothetical protein
MICRTTISCGIAMCDSRCRDCRYRRRNRGSAVHRRDRRRFPMLYRRRTTDSHGGRRSRGARRDGWRRDCLCCVSVRHGRLRRAGAVGGLAWVLGLLGHGSHRVNFSKMTSCGCSGECFCFCMTYRDGTERQISFPEGRSDIKSDPFY